MNLGAFTDRTGGGVEVVEGYRPDDAHRVVIPVERREEHQKLVQHLERRRQLSVKPVQDVQHQRLQRVRADQRVVRAQ